MAVKQTTEQFIEKSKKIHNNRYDYSLVNYTNNHINVRIICPIHGEFSQQPINHLNGQGCRKCSSIRQSKLQQYTTDIFIEKSHKIHQNKYDYSLADYTDSFNKIEIICRKHGMFRQLPSDHIRGIGCPKCNESKGERTIREFLITNNIKFEYQKKFNDCKFINILPFDFYLEEKNICIEYDGEQHYKPKIAWGGEESLKIQRIKDKIKTKFCIKNQIILIRIKYSDNIKNKLLEILNFI